MKDCGILKNKTQLLYLAIVNDIIKVWVVLNNLKKTFSWATENSP